MADRNRNDDGVQVVAEDSLNDNSNSSTNVGIDVDDSGNDNSTDNSNNSTNVNLDVDDSGNDNSTDNSNNSTNVNLDVDDSGNDNSNNSTNVDLDVDDSGNENSFNDNSTSFDLDVSDSFQDNTDNSVRTQDSFNITSSFNTQTLNDHSTTVGIRQYQAGFGDFNAGLVGGGKAAGAGAAGDLSVDNRSAQVDQSVSQAINTGGGFGSGNVSQTFNQDMTIAFGDGSNAAGDDVTIDNSVFNLNIGDIAIGNTDISTRIEDAFKDQSTNYDVNFDLDIADSFNDESQSYDVDVDIDDSFTSEVDAAFENSYEWENNGNIFSPNGSTTGGESDIEF